MNGKFAANRCGCIFARRVAFAALCLAFTIDLVMLKLGLGNDGWDWAFRMPDIVKAGIVGLTFSIVGIFGLIHSSGHLDQKAGINSKGNDYILFCR